jgi:hypothetical protein
MFLAGYQCAQRAANTPEDSPEFAVDAYLNLGRKGRISSWAVCLRSGQWKIVSHNVSLTRHSLEKYSLVWKNGMATEMSKRMKGKPVSFSKKVRLKPDGSS